MNLTTTLLTALTAIFMWISTADATSPPNAIQQPIEPASPSDRHEVPAAPNLENPPSTAFRRLGPKAQQVGQIILHKQEAQADAERAKSRFWGDPRFCWTTILSLDQTLFRATDHRHRR